MSTPSATCPECNAPLPPNTALCPACLLQRGLEPNTLSPTLPAAPWVPPSVEELAPFFPDLDLLSLLGRGGMGAVYKARQKSLDRLIALKILPPQLAADASFPQRFTHEAQALARLNHPHIVTIYDFGQRSGQWPVVSGQTESSPLATDHRPLTTLFFLSMEYIDGLSLRQLLTASRLDPETALAIVPQICDALQYAHDRGIVHRDIKPENILLTQTGTIKIADFGLAKIMSPSPPSDHWPPTTDHSTLAGTPQYMAPEQSTAPNAVDHRADIYALGVVFYQMLTGELPTGKFAAPSTKVHLDIRLDEIVLRALNQNPELRYQNATQFKTEIETVVTTPPPATPTSPPPPRSGSPVPPQTEAPLSVPRLSITALVGAILGPSILALGFVIPAITGPVSNANPFAMLLVHLTQFLFFTTAAGVTGLGFLALSQIRRSHGRLYGLPLALFDILLFPLLALDALLAFLLFNAAIAFLGWSRDYSDLHDSQLIIATVFFSAIIDTLIIRWAWRAIAPQSPPPPRGGATVPAPQTAPSAPPTPHPFELRSRTTLLGLPLLHITGGIDPLTRRPRVAHGIIAIGPFARGFLALGGFTFGFISIGGLAVGIIPLGGLSLGCIALGGFAVGVVSLMSGLGLGVFFANAGLAVAPYAVGGLAVGHEITGGLTIPLNPFWSALLAATSASLLLLALYVANKICSPSAAVDSSRPALPPISAHELSKKFSRRF